MNLKIVIAVLIACVLTAPTVGAVRETNDKDVDRAIKAATGYLWSQQMRGGSWEHLHYCYRHRLPSGFPTAIITFALLEAGESYENDVRMKRAIDVLTKIKTNDLRVRAIRAMVLSRAVGNNKKSPYRKALLADLKWISRGRGKWGNAGPERFGDNFCSHLALTALWEARLNANVAIPKKLFRMGQKVWENRQKPDGGWAFSGLPGNKMKPDVRITAAGLASMYICRDALSTASGKSRQHKTMSKAWDYLDKNFNDKFMKRTKENANSSYTGFCIQQIGMTSGEKFINNVDWYAVAARELAKPQPYGKRYTRNAYWGPLVRGAFELIILARGRLPLTYNKLNYGKDTKWDYHPRDIARFTEYMQRNFERRMRWQIVRINDNVQTLLDAPIMLIAGQDAMKLDDKQWGRLKEYTLRGGTLLFIAVKQGEKFLESVREKLKTLYAGQHKEAGEYYELQKLPEKHPIYRVYKKLTNGAKKYPMWGLSDGTRLLAVICEKDIARAWQGRKEISHKRDFILGVNFFRYATGQNSLSTRMRPVFTPGEKLLPIRETMKVGWVKHEGNWCSQPYALDYLAQKLATENQVSMKITRGVPIRAGAMKPFKLLWMTGSGDFELSAEQLAALREYLYGGGTLMINAVGGARKFQRSARKLLDELFQDDEDISGNFASANSSLMTGKCGEYRGPKLGKLDRTTAFVRTHPKAVEPVMEYRNREGRILVAFLRFGMHDTLDGHTAYNAKSYMPPSARDIAANIVLSALVSKPGPAELQRHKDRKLRTKKEKTAVKKKAPPKKDAETTKLEKAGKPAKKKKKSSFLDDDDDL